MKKSDELIWAGVGFDLERATTGEAKERIRILDLLEHLCHFHSVGYRRDCDFKDTQIAQVTISVIHRRENFLGMGIICLTDAHAREKLPLLAPVFRYLQIAEAPGIWKLYFGPIQVE